MIPFPSGPFSVIAADPPWHFKSFSRDSAKIGRPIPYETMNLKQIAALPVGDIAAKHCHLFLWTTGPTLPDAFGIMKAWGFKYSAVGFTWVKTKRSAPLPPWDESSFHLGLGYTTRKNCEWCLIGRKGSPKRLSASVRELLIAPVREHSRKPDEAYRRIEQYAAGPYIELFGRQQRSGWIVWGNESEKFS